MRPPAFWDASPRHPFARALAPVGALYGRFTAARMDRPGTTGSCPVLCVGNLTLGGAGKTPTALAIAAMLHDLGARPAFLTRGYGGSLAGPVLVDHAHHNAAQVGDEPLLLARAATTVVSRDRPAGARLCAETGASVIVMDDGLQNPNLAKDLSLAVVDAGVGIGNGLPFPAGPLRVPLERQWRHVDGLVLVGEGEAGERVVVLARDQGLPVLRARLLPDLAERHMAGRRLLAFAGIGRPEKFFATLRDTGADVVAQRSFPDHHAYREGELAGLNAEAKRLGASLITTQKDLVRLPAAFAERVEVLAVSLFFESAGDVLPSLRQLISVSRAPWRSAERR